MIDCVALAHLIVGAPMVFAGQAAVTDILTEGRCIAGGLGITTIIENAQI
jgi:hypothetical protein